ncbi:MAG: RHS repeat-associated core domain-containing protein [Armatimonadota bacterium]
MHRYLDPATGRFLTRDPIGLEGGMNLYAYCRNRVVMLSDRSGTIFYLKFCCTRPLGRVRIEIRMSGVRRDTIYGIYLKR